MAKETSCPRSPWHCLPWFFRGRGMGVRVFNEKRSSLEERFFWSISLDEQFNLLENKFQVWGLNPDRFTRLSVSMVRRDGQAREVRRVIVAKDHCSIFPLVVIGVSFLNGMFLPNKEFPEMQKRIVNEINIATQKPDSAAIFMGFLRFIDKRASEKYLVNP